MAAPYIPAPDSGFSSWLLNFATLIAANPTTYGLLAGDATAISAQNTAFQAAYLAATNPATRTAPTVATKDATRATAEAIVRPYAMRIRNNTTVSNALKIGLGLTIPSTTPTPIPAPSVAPVLGLQAAIPMQMRMTYKDPTAVGKAKPYGVIGTEIWRALGTVPAVDPAAATYYGTFGKSPFFSDFVAEDQGKVCTYFARFITRSGPAGKAQKSAFSAPFAVNVI